MNERFESIIIERIKKYKDFTASYFIILILLIASVLLFFYVHNKNISYLTFVFSLISILLIPIRKKALLNHQWILDHYQTEQEECLKLLNFYKNNLNGTSLLGFIFIKGMNQETIHEYREAIKILKGLEGEK